VISGWSKHLKLVKLAPKIDMNSLMNTTFNQSVTFVLNKAHFQECFDQSASPVQNKDYFKAALIGGIGGALLFVEAEHYYIPFFLITLGILEVFSVIYRKTWWVWRQLMGKSGNSQVTLTVNDEGIRTKSQIIDAQILWSDVTEIEQTDKGFLIKHKSGVNYLSKSSLNERIIEFVLSKNQ